MGNYCDMIEENQASWPKLTMEDLKKVVSGCKIHSAKAQSHVAGFSVLTLAKAQVNKVGWATEQKDAFYEVLAATISALQDLESFQSWYYYCDFVILLVLILYTITIILSDILTHFHHRRHSI